MAIDPVPNSRFHSEQLPIAPESHGGSPSNFSLLLKLFRRHYLLMLLPVGIFSVVAAAYVLTREPEWKSTQTLQVRDELAVQTVMPGRFNSLDMMKMFQETLHEMVRRHSVVKTVLKRVGPPEEYRKPEQWPTAEDIEAMQGSISLSPPNGAQFGRTEILLLSVKARTISRANQIVVLLAGELQKELNQLRDKRATSIENELIESVRIAEADMRLSNQKLSAFESEFGGNLVDLRSISNDNGSGSTALQSRLSEMMVESRDAAQRLDALTRQWENIRGAVKDPENLLSFSGELLTAQPSLQKLKEELIRIQAETAKTLGQFEVHHAKSRAALEAEKRVHQKIVEEVQLAERGLKSQIDSIKAELAALEKSSEGVEKQLQKLADFRAPYALLVKRVDQNREILNKSLEDLSRARATRVAAQTTNLITLLDEPYNGSRPEGTSKKLIVGAAGFAGLLSGIGLVFFAASPSFIGPLSAERPTREDSRLNSAREHAADAESESNQQRKSARKESELGESDLGKSDLEIRKFVFDYQDDEVDYEEIFGELHQETKVSEMKPGLASFDLQPRRSEPLQTGSHDSMEVQDSAGLQDSTEQRFQETSHNPLESDPDLKLEEKHRIQIERMFRDESE